MTSNQLPRQVAVLLGHICQQTCFSPHQSHKQWKTRHHMANSKTLEVHLYTTSARGWSHMENAIRSTWYKRGFKLKMHTWRIRHMQSLHIIYLSKHFDHTIHTSIWWPPKLTTLISSKRTYLSCDPAGLWNLVNFHDIHDLVKGLKNNPLSHWLWKELSLFTLWQLYTLYNVNFEFFCAIWVWDWPG